MSRIKPMHRGPAVAPVANEHGNSLFPCNADQPRNKAVIAFAVDRWGKPHHRSADSARSQRLRRLLRLARKVGIVRILFCRERALPLREQSPRSDDQRAVRAREHAAESLYGLPVDLATLFEFRKVVNKGGVNYCIRIGSSAAQAFQVLNISPVRLGPAGCNRFGGCIVACQAEYLMASLN